jgi:flagellar motor switch protein FliM
MNSAFDPLSAVTFRFDRLETNPRFATIARPQNAALLVKLRVDMEDRGGRIEIVIPYATLEPVRELLLQQFMGEKFGRDSIWESHLANEMLETDIEVQAILDEVTIGLRDVINWQPGSQFALNVKPEDLIDIRSGDVSLFRAHMGQRNSHIAVKVEEETLRNQKEE